MFRWHIILSTFALASSCFGCAGPLKVGYVTPHPNHAGIYLVHYWPADRLLDEYGTGSEDMYQKLKKLDSTNEDYGSKVMAIWNEAYGEAVRNYLVSTNRTPSECGNGIILVGSSPNEGDGGATEFRCK